MELVVVEAVRHARTQALELEQYVLVDRRELLMRQHVLGGIEAREVS